MTTSLGRCVWSRSKRSRGGKHEHNAGALRRGVPLRTETELAGTVLGLGAGVLLMSWLWWTLIGIFVFAAALFFLSCAWLSHYLECREDDTEDWY